MNRQEVSLPMFCRRDRSYGRSMIDLLVCLAGLVLLIILPARGQNGSTSLEGIVEDASGARIAHAEISLLNPDNGFRSSIVTDGEGRFRFAMLAPGRYSITVSAAS